jgi:exopolyphosphatase/guanosine-5'-triphosphate,3'-diphosphate pyrophosphatase
MRNVATQACREALNHEEFMIRVEKEVRIKLDIIDAGEEARLAMMGCKALLDPKCSHAVVFDVGGGSTEIIWLKIGKYKNPEIIDWVSVPFGVVNLSEKFDSKKTITAERYKAMMQMIDDAIRGFVKKNNIKSVIGQGTVQLLGSSGTVTTLTSMHLGLNTYDRNKVDGASVTAARMQEMCDQLSGLSYAERIKKPSIGEDRAELVVAGCAIIEVIMAQMPINDIRVADRGIREGMLLDLMEAGQQKRRKRRNRYRRFSKSKNTSETNANN